MSVFLLSAFFLRNHWRLRRVDGIKVTHRLTRIVVTVVIASVAACSVNRILRRQLRLLPQVLVRVNLTVVSKLLHIHITTDSCPTVDTRVASDGISAHVSMHQSYSWNAIVCFELAQTTLSLIEVLLLSSISLPARLRNDWVAGMQRWRCLHVESQEFIILAWPSPMIAKGVKSVSGAHHLVLWLPHHVVLVCLCSRCYLTRSIDAITRLLKRRESLLV